jgi:hypothetical protein
VTKFQVSGAVQLSTARPAGDITYTKNQQNPAGPARIAKPGGGGENRCAERWGPGGNENPFGGR